MQSVYSTILVKDIILLENIIKILIENIDNLISANKIAKINNLSGKKTTANTVARYLKHLTDSYFFYKVNRYDVKTERILPTLGKYYLVDTGLKNLLVGSLPSDYGQIIENIVYLELSRRGYSVNIGKIAEKEVNFVAKNANEWFL